MAYATRSSSPSSTISINWGRANSMWPMFFGLSCCFVETGDLDHLAPRHLALRRRGDARLAAPVRRHGGRGHGVQEDGARADPPLRADARAALGHLDGIVLELGRHVRRLLGGAGRATRCCRSTSYVQGCPPRPESLLEALMLLQQKIKRDEHPMRDVLRKQGGTSGNDQAAAQGRGVTTDRRSARARASKARARAARSAAGHAISPPPTSRPGLRPRRCVRASNAGSRAVEAGLRERLGGRRRAIPGVRTDDTLTWRVTPRAARARARLLEEPGQPALPPPRVRWPDSTIARAAPASAWSTTSPRSSRASRRCALAVDLGADNPHVPTVTLGLPGGELVRARDARHVRHPHRRPSRSAPPLHAVVLEGPSAAQGSSLSRLRDGALHHGGRVEIGNGRSTEYPRIKPEARARMV